ncbi:MAG: transposase [Planctomycetota bacterium]|jgi:transposase|nr:transposase [Planctomycetota bacterium]
MRHCCERGGRKTPQPNEIVKRNELHAFKALPNRRIVERTFGWPMYWRIMNRRHERKYDTAENVMRIAMTKNMLRYLTISQDQSNAA